jgi:Ferritin-like domain
MNDITRSAFLKKAAVGGGAAVAAGAAVGLPAGPAAAAPSEQDLAWVRFAVTSEFVWAEYSRRARASGLFRGDELRALERANAALNAHFTTFRTTLEGLNEPAIDKADLEVELPDDAFRTRSGALRLGRRIGALCVHAYLGALTTVADSSIRKLFAQVAASDAEILAYLTGLAGPPIGDPFPSVHGLPTASEELARYLP